MPNKKSAVKELRKTIKRKAANKKMADNIKNLTKKNLKKIATNDQEVKKEYIQTIKALDKAVKKGILKKNTVARKKSSLMKKVNAIK
ncbi:30S ribosomal protein S20 [Candidatus Falkowbacteria bacterium]|uniref:Small ribosomal subunit protein bS20 n=1 Tax=Candidatus Falkowbacteria bacterium CG10_big_fil_rev_8_21_14_0_10_37_18 TaxID=1974562 RepID=A0A2H0V8F8_9BACT|nr:30S ribosomal protein S20 [Candidatus Falkowbacteria bacterium]NCQ12990.1 30S ribosomal protein S20 [Candidatus Falkowbacteria bacterium]PIR95358.1 MAG: 30S ribosomal protein S20 [Candidatus Falkowbacteria bacterium CG10_big_fil_rev_8_21_14_0_10_37_18]